MGLKASDRREIEILIASQKWEAVAQKYADAGYKAKAAEFGAMAMTAAFDAGDVTKAYALAQLYGPDALPSSYNRNSKPTDHIGAAQRHLDRGHVGDALASYVHAKRFETVDPGFEEKIVAQGIKHYQ